MQTLLVTVDALRADRLGQYGYERDTMPALDRLGDEGVRFDSAFANGPYTRISIPAIHTSRYLGYERLTDLPTLASVLADAGAKTAFVGTQAGFAGYKDDVFDEYSHFGRDEYHERSSDDESIRDVARRRLQDVVDVAKPLVRKNDRTYRLAERAYDAATSVTGKAFNFQGYTDAARITDEALAWLDEHGDEPFFCWIHYMEGHRPYGVHDPDPRYLDEPIDEETIRSLMKVAGTEPDDVTVRQHRLLRDLYDSDLRYCSRHLNRLFDGLADRGIWEEASVVLTSDHGEEFYEHGQYFHRNLPYDELLHVRLYLKAPSTDPGVVAEQRQLLDVEPTICDLHDVDPPETFLGEDLRTGEERQVIAVGSQLHRDEGVVAGRWDGWKFLHTAAGDSLYDLGSDPSERESVADDHPDVVELFRAAIPDELFAAEGATLRDPSDKVDRERLEALGYLELQE